MRRLGLALALLLWAAPCLAALVGSTSTTSNTVNVPSGTVNGNVMVLFSNSFATEATPTGWTPICNTGTLSSGGGLIGYLYLRVASSEPTSYTVASSAGVNVMRVYSGVTASVTPDASNCTTTGSSATLNTPAFSGLSTNGDLYVGDYLWGGGAAGTVTFTETGSLGNGPNNTSYVAGVNAGAFVGDLTASSNSVAAQTGTTSATSVWGSIAVALKPFACSTLTQITICPEGRGLNGVCDLGSDTIENLSSCYVCPMSTPCVAHVTDAQSCSAGQTPLGAGSGNCSVAWSSSLGQWLAN